MPAKDALPILDTLLDIFEQMAVGNALGIQIREIARRLHLVKAECRWNHGHGVLAAKLRAQAALYAMRFVPDDGDGDRRFQNGSRLDATRIAFLALRQHLEREAAEDIAFLAGRQGAARSPV